jgi:hypothetical protein
VIEAVDEALRNLLRREALNGSQIDVVFDAPTSDWASRRNAPTLDVYLYDIREDLPRREYGQIDVLDDAGRITGRRQPLKFFKLNYLITAWTQRPEDEHRLLSAVLGCLLRFPKLPSDVLTGQLAGQVMPIPVSAALPLPEDRSLSDAWSALGGELKPSIDVIVSAPFDTRVVVPAAPLVQDLPALDMLANGTRLERVAPRGSGATNGHDGPSDASATADTKATAPPAKKRNRRPPNE